MSTEDVTPLTKVERTELTQLVKMRGRLGKADVDAVKAERIATFEAELAAQFPANDPRWEAITADAERAIKTLDAEIAARCKAEGIRPEFRPGLIVRWYERGENGIENRRAELRKVAQSQADAYAFAAKAEVDKWEVNARTEIVKGGLTSDAARAFLDSMPTAGELLPTLRLAELDKP